jgi:hypothetical protein
MAIDPRQLVSMVRREQGTLDKMEAEHIRRLSSSINELENNIRSYMEQLQTGGGGALTGVKVNLKQAQAIHKQILQEFETTYGVTVRQMIEDYDELSEFIEGSFSDLNIATSFTGLDRTMMDILKQRTYDDYMEYGVQAQNRIATSMYNAVLAGTSRADLEKTIRGILKGQKDVRGRPMETYAKQHTKDAVMNFYNEVHQKKAEDAGLRHFMYFGDIINTSRQFCRVRVGKYYTKKQIDSWTHSWAGKRGPAWDYRGGWNCRHHWRGMDPDWLEEDEFGAITEDEMVAYIEAENFDQIDGMISDKEAMKKKHKASLEKSKKLRAQREKLKTMKLTPARKQKIKDLRQELIKEKKYRDELKGSITKAKGDLRKQGRKIKRDVAEGKTPKPLTKKELSPPEPTTKSSTKTLSTTEMHDRGIERFVESAEGVGGKYGNFEKQVMDPLISEHERYMRFGNGILAEPMAKSGKRIVVEAFNEMFIPEHLSRVGAEAWGSHGLHFAGGRIQIGALRDALKRMGRGNIGIGGWHIAETPLTAYTHEFGHHVHKVLLDEIDPKLKRAWRKIYKGQRRSWWMDNVSDYASGNEFEAFAESFSAYTHPKYKRGMLPKEVEKYFDDLFGYKAKTAKKVAEKAISTAMPKHVAPSPGWAKQVEKYHAIGVKKWAKLQGVTPKEFAKAMDDAIRRVVMKADVYVRTPPGVLKAILHDGRFKSQFESGTSKGYLNNYFRRNHEKKLMSYGSNSPANRRPIYGYLSEGSKSPPGTAQYGSVRIKLKDSVRRRTTFTVGDSIDAIAGGRNPGFYPTPLENPSHYADVLDQWPDSVRDMNPTRYTSVNQRVGVRYWEAQVHGGVTLKDIDTVYFSRRPDAITRELLEDNNINWVVEQ